MHGLSDLRARAARTGSSIQSLVPLSFIFDSFLTHRVLPPVTPPTHQQLLASLCELADRFIRLLTIHRCPQDISECFVAHISLQQSRLIFYELHRHHGDNQLVRDSFDG